MYVPDKNGQVIRKLTPSGAFTIFAGQLGLAGNVNGLGRNALFNGPRGIAIDATDTLYVTEGSRIRRITPDGMVSTLGGDGSPFGLGCTDGPIANATFSGVSDITLDASGNLYFSSNGALIRKISPAGQVTTIAGTRLEDSASVVCYFDTGWQDGPGSQAKFNLPEGIAVDSSGAIYVADRNNNAIRKLTPVR